MIAVKIIGATAHFVTSGLDERLIIEQNMVRVDHGLSREELMIEGSNIENDVLTAAVKFVVSGRCCIMSIRLLCLIKFGSGWYEWKMEKHRD
jgi:formyltetrahydrofolate hydrolase